jgi:prepilin-type N-terminal cleavage/methylation domain-containing protein
MQHRITSHQTTITGRGFSLLEVMIGVIILGFISIYANTFFRDTIYLNRVLEQGLKNQHEARRILRPFVNEVRGASPSSLGAYPIGMASTTSFVFYTDIDDDTLKERVRYFLDGNDFKKGVIKPTGTPLAYATTTEVITDIVHDVMSNPTPIFQYYGSNYNGTTNTAPLTQPVAVESVRLIKVTLTVDSNGDQPPAAVVLTTQASFRNLKDNL